MTLAPIVSYNATLLNWNSRSSFRVRDQLFTLRHAELISFLAYNERVPEQAKKLVWLVDTLDNLRGFPADVRGKLGFALYQAQIGEKHESAKPLHGFEAPVWEVRADDPSGTYRAIYVVHFLDAVYVLHTFQKKAKSGIATPQREIALIRQRLKLARKLASHKGD